MYKVSFGTSNGISTTAALNEIVLIQRNATTCWSRIELEYNLLPDDIYVELVLRPTRCKVEREVDIFLDYKTSLNSQWISIGLPETNTSENNSWGNYNHANWFSYKIFTHSI